MAKFENYFKVVSPQPGVTTMTDNQEIGDQGTYSNSTWYQRLIQGSASRITRYREYDLMDNDIEVARSLDTIAEEMVGSDPNSDMPLELVIESDKDNNIPSSTVMTLRTALRYWCTLHDWDNRLFSVARVTAKYGDCFFIRNKKSTAKWEYVHPKNVVAAIVDDQDMTNVIGWQIKRDTKTPNSPYNQPTGHFGNYSTELVDTFSADEVVWFSFNDDISDSAPFGESVLRAVYRAHKQKELLEDAIIIYRIQRAPELRKFRYGITHNTKPTARISIQRRSGGPVNRGPCRIIGDKPMVRLMPKNNPCDHSIALCQPHSCPLAAPANRIMPPKQKPTPPSKPVTTAARARSPSR